MKKSARARATRAAKTATITLRVSPELEESVARMAAIFGIKKSEALATHRGWLEDTARDLAVDHEHWDGLFAYDPAEAMRVAARYFAAFPDRKYLRISISGATEHQRILNPAFPPTPPRVLFEPADESDKVTVSVTMTREQFAVFDPAAKQAKATVGEVLLALACAQLNLSIDEDHAVEELESGLWSFSTGKFLPRVAKEWGEAGFPVTRADPAPVLAEGGAAS